MPLERVHHFVRGREPIGRNTGKRREHDILQPPRHGLANGAQREGSFRQAPRNHGLRRGPGEGSFTAQHLVQHAAETVHVAPAVHFTVGELFRTHVRRCADGHTGFRQPLGARFGDRTGNPEIGDNGVTRLQEDVLRLDVPMHHALAVRVAQGVSDFLPKVHDIVNGELALAFQAVT